MIVNTSSNSYNSIQDTADLTGKNITSQPVSEASEQKTPLSSDQTTLSGTGLMMSRLFGNTSSNPVIQTQLTKDNMAMDSVNFLTTDDRNTLSELYDQARQQGTDLRYVDDLARDLGSYRMFGNVMSNANNGTLYDLNGHQQSYEFTDSDKTTASRILNSGKMADSGLDSGFLNYELDAGFSSSHSANFSYLESVVNKTNQDSTDAGQTSPFSIYQRQSKENYVVKTASEVTLKKEEPDYRCVDGVFSVTETGLKHGYRLEGGQVVKDSPSATTNDVSASRVKLLQYLLSTEKQNDNKLASLLNLLSAGKNGTTKTV